MVGTSLAEDEARLVIQTKLELNPPSRRGLFRLPKGRSVASAFALVARKPTWAFMHIPKTSGVAITEGLARALTNPLGRRLTKAIYGRPQILTGFDRSLHGGFDRFDTFDASVRARLHLEDLPTGARVISGHFAFSTLRRSAPAARIFTILREPLCRLLSHWVYWRQYTEEELLPYGLWADRTREARRPLAEFLRSPTVACQTDNIVVRMLLWPHHLLPADGFIKSAHDGELITEARMRLDEMFHVDTFENPNLVGGLEGLIGRSIEYRRVNETRAPTHEFYCDLDEHLTKEARELLTLRCRLDLHLWNHAITRVLPGTSAHVIREAAIGAGIARYRDLLKGRNAAG